MGEKKGTSRIITIATGSLCIALLIGLFIMSAQYTSVLQTKDTQIADSNAEILSKDFEIADKNTQIDSLQNQISELNGQIDSLNGEVSNLNKRIANLTAPKLVPVGFTFEDDRSSSPYTLRMHGYIYNTGATAYNAKLHIVAYNVNGKLAIDTYYPFGGVVGGYSLGLQPSVSYEGAAIENWTVIPEWTNSLGSFPGNQTMPPA